MIQLISIEQVFRFTLSSRDAIQPQENLFNDIDENEDNRPIPEDLARAAKERVVVEIRLAE